MAIDDKDGKIWVDGKLVEWRDATVHVLTHTLHYGMGVFEGVRAYKQSDGGTAIFRLADHTKRLFNSAKIFQMCIPFDQPTIEAAHLEVIRANHLDSCYIRPLVWIGSEALGISAPDNTIHVAIAAWRWTNYLGEEGAEKGIRVKTSSFTHHHPNVAMCRAKAVSNYPVSILSKREALNDGYDEAMLLDTHGFVCQGSGENVYLVTEGEIHTPDLAGGALDGVTRNTMKALANEFGLKWIERRITRDEFYIADEAFFTGTAAEVIPIREYDGRKIGDGTRGPITEQLQSAYFDIVTGRDPKYAHWLSRI